MDSHGIDNQALKFFLEGAQQFSSCKRQFYEESLLLTVQKGTIAKAQGTTAIAVGAMGFEAC